MANKADQISNVIIQLRGCVGTVFLILICNGCTGSNSGYCHCKPGLKLLHNTGSDTWCSGYPFADSYLITDPFGTDSDNV